MTEPIAPTPAVREPADPTTEAVIECRSLTKVFRDFWLRPRVTAVDRLDLWVDEGEIFGLLGPNGSGKSTTLKLILGLLFPTRGEIRVLGQPPETVRVKARIGYLPEESHLYPYLNAEETLDYYGRLLRLERSARRERTEELIEMVGLAAARRRPVGEFSKGMQRRLGLAQALINDPDLLVLDEPTAGLDPIGTRQVKDLVEELGRRGKTVVITSHLLADVEDVCSRLAILYGGRVRRSGTVDELLIESDALLLRTDPVSEETLAAVRRLLEQDGRELQSVTRPRQRLERLFLSIIEAARSEGVRTSGAGEGGATAEFLRQHSGDSRASRDPQ